MVSKICLVTKEAKQVKKPRGCEVLAREGRPEDASWVAQANENTFFIQATMFREKFVQFHLNGIQVKTHVKSRVFLLGKGSLI